MFKPTTMLLFQLFWHRNMFLMQLTQIYGPIKIFMPTTNKLLFVILTDKVVSPFTTLQKQWPLEDLVIF